MNHFDVLFGPTIPSITENIKISKDYGANQQPNYIVMVGQRLDPSQAEHELQ